MKIRYGTTSFERLEDVSRLSFLHTIPETSPLIFSICLLTGLGSLFTTVGTVSETIQSARATSIRIVESNARFPNHCSVPAVVEANQKHARETGSKFSCHKRACGSCLSCLDVMEATIVNRALNDLVLFHNKERN